MALRFGDIVDVLLDTTFHITPHLSEFIDYMAMRVCVLIYRIRGDANVPVYVPS